MNARDYKIIEHRSNINVNVFGCNNRVFPIYVSEKNNDRVLNVLLISNEEKSHYVFIKDFNKLLCSQTGTKNQHKKYYCMHCLQNFTTEEILNKHKELCSLINGTHSPIYEKGIIKFENYDRQLPTPFKVYADIECYTKK